MNNETTTESQHDYATRVTQEKRQIAYADPINGSDRLFAEASRMKLMSEDSWEENQAEAIARYEEIKAAYPWPINVETNNE